LNKPIFAWSGGNPGVTKAINGSDFVVANVQTNARKESQSYRSRDRAVPHNLYAQGSGLFTMQPEGATPPPQQFAYRKATDTAEATPTATPTTAAGVTTATPTAAVTTTMAARRDRRHDHHRGRPE